MQWSQRHIQISRCLSPSLVCSGSLPSALQLRWLWFPFWSALPKRPRLPRSAPWRAWRPPRVALQWGAMTVRAKARHLMLRANPHCHRTRWASLLHLILKSVQSTYSQGSGMCGIPSDEPQWHFPDECVCVVWTCLGPICTHAVYSIRHKAAWRLPELFRLVGT